jgi:hypothetical protein
MERLRKLVACIGNRRENPNTMIWGTTITDRRRLRELKSIEDRTKSIARRNLLDWAAA